MLNRCTLCVMPNTRPDCVFVNGVCPACHNALARRQIDWEARRIQLEQLLDRHHGEVLAASSGGKDSHFIALTLKAMGADVTAVTARTCHLTNIGRANIDNLARHVRTVEYVPNMTVRATLNRIGLRLVGDISHPEHMAIFSTPLRAALDLRRPLVMYGENPNEAYGGPPGSEAARTMAQNWMHELGGLNGLRPSDCIGLDGLTALDMRDYELPSVQALKHYNVEAHFLGMYVPWDSHANAAVAMTHGLKIVRPSLYNYWNCENLDNYQTGIHDYFMWLKYGFGRACSQLSIDIRHGVLSREEALKILERIERLMHYGPPDQYMGKHMCDILAHIDLSETQFKEHIQRWDSRHASSRQYYVATDSP